MIEIGTLTLYDALSVANRMREIDRAGVLALLGPCSPEQFAISRFQSHGAAWALREDGEPQAIGGLELVNPWTGILWMAAVEGMPSHSWRKLIRQTRTVMRNVLNPSNQEHRPRIEAHVLEGWEFASEFAQRMGLHYEGTRWRAGSQGENIQMWAAVAA